jgi:vanillate O-demethylase ferredoxin subunit
MHRLRVGDTVRAQPPKCDFALRDHAAPALLLAGGIGVTPLISMATALREADRPFRLVHAARSRGASGFATALSAAFGDVVALASDDEAPLDLDALMAGLEPGAQLYICGPRGMIEAARTAAAAAGVPGDRVHVELFTNDAAQGSDSAFEVEIASSGQVFTIPPGRTIIEVLEEAGVDLIHDCQRGDCGICQTDVISGTPDHRDVVLSEAERAAGNVMQICVSRARSPRLVLDL